MKEFKSFLNTVEGNEGSKCHYPTRLDTYGCGCSHDCKYCYAKSLLSFRNLWNPEKPSVVDLRDVWKQVVKIPKGSVVRLGGMTDCFQPVERNHKTTYGTIKMLNRRKIGYLIVTESASVAEDDYMAILNKDLAHIQVTVTTLDDDLARTYEKASPPSERVKAILKLQEAGFDVAIRVSPFMPEYMDTEKLSRLGIEKCIVEFLRVNSWIRRWFPINFAAYTRHEGGYDHLSLDDKKRLISQIKGFKSVSVCEDCDADFLYWRDNFNPNPEDCCNLRKEQKNEN